MTAKNSGKTYILTLTCVDQPGIVSAVSTALASLGCNIIQSNQYGDAISGKFFMRVQFQAPDKMPQDGIETALGQAAARFEMDWSLYDEAVKPRIVILASKTDHCLRDLIYNVGLGIIKGDIVHIASNHETVKPIAEGAGIDFSHLPITKQTKPAQEAKLRKLFDETKADLIVLARYMQVLSDELSNDYFGKIINIHHAFLPAFKGANPYKRAHDRGVKLIGATAHYVTPDLDEGPIIEQETERVNHGMSARDLINVGRGIERRVLSRAVAYHCDHKILLNGDKTVVFA